MVLQSIKNYVRDKFDNCSLTSYLANFLLVLDFKVFLLDSVL